ARGRSRLLRTRAHRPRRVGWRRAIRGSDGGGWGEGDFGGGTDDGERRGAGGGGGAPGGPGGGRGRPPRLFGGAPPGRPHGPPPPPRPPPLAPRRSSIPPSHLVLLAETREGYGNLATLVTRARMDNGRGEPSVTLDVLAQHAAGLFALTGCPRGWVPSLV